MEEKIIESASAYSLSILARVWLHDEVFELICSRPEGFRFQAGQHVAIIDQGTERDYTIISAPEEQELRFLIKLVPGGNISKKMAEIPLGSPVRISRPRGYLNYRPSNRQAIFVATGVGVAPFVSMAASGVKGFKMIHGARSGPGFFYRKELAAAALCYIPCISTDDRSCADWPSVFRGHVTEYVKKTILPGPYDFYLCGSLTMIREMTHILDQSQSDIRVYSEAFN